MGFMGLASIACDAPPVLRPWVSQFWVSHSPADARAMREYVLPTGQMHLVVRLSGPALRVFDGRAPGGATTVFRGPVVGGARDHAYAKERTGAVSSVGAVLRPGAAQALFGVSAAELAGRHTLLADLSGADAADALQAQLADARDAQQRIDRLVRWLMRRVVDAPPLPASLQHALDALARPARVAAVVREGGLSHRGFIAQFRQATGLGPKRYARLMRFGQLLAELRSRPGLALGELALHHGYSDQAHMTREFRAIAGTSPSHYRVQATAHAHHLILPAAR